jgi:HlyD family secretion protein
MNNKKTYWIIGIALLLVATLIVLNKLGIVGKESLVEVAVETVGKHDIIETVTASGKIYPVAEVKISPDVSGELTELYIEEGDSVTKGQVLASINSTIYKSMVNKANAQLNQTKSSVSNANALKAQAKAQLDQASSTFMRNRQLFAEKVISASEFEAAESAYKAAKANFNAAIESIKGNQFGVQSATANVNEAVQTLQKTTIYAPMSGIISALYVKKGERVVGTAQMAGTEIMRVANMSKMKVDVEVGENDITKVKLGDSANIDIEAYPDRIFKGIVSKISQSSTGLAALQGAGSMNEQVTNYTVSIELLPVYYADLTQIDNRNFPFRPGMSASVEILTKYERAKLAVPINAVTTREEEEDKNSDLASSQIQEYVFLVNDKNETVLQAVKTTIQDNDYIQISNGLKGGEKIIVAPFSAISRSLKKGTKVKVVDKKDLFEKKTDN